MSLDAVISILNSRKGEANAITLQAIADTLGLSRRDVEHVIEFNLDSIPFPVCSCSSGLFRPAQAEELNHYLATLRSRSGALARRIQTTEVKARLEGWTLEAGQYTGQPLQQQLF